MRAIVHTIRVYADTQSSEAVKFILHNREEHVFILMHTDLEKTVVRQIQHAVHIASIIVYGVASPSDKPSIKVQNTTLVLYERDLYRAIDLLSTSVQSQRNNAFWFYESKQMKSADLTTESAACFWQQLLPSILIKTSSVDISDFITLALQWYRTNPLVLCEIEQFRKEYNSEAAKCWFFTNGSSFVQRMLRQAFKQGDMQIIWSARFLLLIL